MAGDLVSRSRNGMRRKDVRVAAGNRPLIRPTFQDAGVNAEFLTESCKVQLPVEQGKAVALGRNQECQVCEVGSGGRDAAGYPAAHQ